MTQTIPDDKLHRLLLSDFEVRELINALDHYATGPRGKLLAGRRLLALRWRLWSSQAT
jgi:hypothetical protein